MSNPDSDNRDCTPSSPSFTSSPGEKTATPSEEVKVSLLKGEGAAFFVKTNGLKSVAGASEEAKHEDSQKKYSCCNEIRTGASVDGRSFILKPDFIGSSYPTRFENLSPGDHTKWWDSYHMKYGYFFKDEFSLDLSFKGNQEKESDDLSNYSDGEEAGTSISANLVHEEPHVEITGSLVICDPSVMEFYHMAMSEWSRYLQTEKVPEGDGPGLCWGLMALALKTNGMVSGRDIGELLIQKINSFEKRVYSAGIQTTSIVMLLVAGKHKEALDLAMDRGLMDHAFILQSNLEKQPSQWIKGFIDRLDKDPLKTYYQVRLGEIPSVASACGDLRWGDWRLHLAIVLVHSSWFGCRQEAVDMMEETLASKGLTCAAQFCQMVLELEPESLRQTPVARFGRKWLDVFRKLHWESNMEVIQDSQGLQSDSVPSQPEEMEACGESDLVENVITGSMGETAASSDAGMLGLTTDPTTDVTLDSPTTMKKTISFDDAVPENVGKGGIASLSQDEGSQDVGPVDGAVPQTVSEGSVDPLSEDEGNQLIGPVLPPVPSEERQPLNDKVPDLAPQTQDDEEDSGDTLSEIKETRQKSTKSKKSWFRCFTCCWGCFGKKEID